MKKMISPISIILAFAIPFLLLSIWLISPFFNPTAARGRQKFAGRSLNQASIHDIQGSGPQSPLFGQTVQAAPGAVTHLTPNGFFMQEPHPDADPLTSEGIYVHTVISPTAAVGDLVSVEGKVSEYRGLTELTYVTVTVVGAETIFPLVLDLPIPAGATYEPYEGMLVCISETLAAAQNTFQGRYGQVTLSAEGRMYHPHNGNGLGDSLEYNLRRMIILDDGTEAQNPNPIPYIFEQNTLRAGDTLNQVTGILDEGLINSSGGIYYRLQPTGQPIFTRLNPRPPAPEEVGGNLRVASFNVLNYFNGDGLGGGFPTARGADTLLEFERQRAKMITALLSLDADVIGLVEIENDGEGPTSAVQDLVNGLNASADVDAYSLIVEPAPGDDEIKVAMIYKSGVVTPVGTALNYQVAGGVDYDPLFDRPPLAQTFSLNANGEILTVIVNHFKSKSGCPTSGPDADQGDGQGCWNAKRLAQADGLLDFVLELQTTTGDTDVLVIGDLNAYGQEDPVLALLDGGLVNAVAVFVPAEWRYSYVFDGFAGYLDHGLATPSQMNQVTEVTFWHINADEPSVLDYNTEYKPQDLYTPDAYRASDHDPLLIGLQLATRSVYLPVIERSP